MRHTMRYREMWCTMIKDWIQLSVHLHHRWSRNCILTVCQAIVQAICLKLRYVSHQYCALGNGESAIYRWKVQVKSPDLQACYKRAFRNILSELLGKEKKGFSNLCLEATIFLKSTVFKILISFSPFYLIFICSTLSHFPFLGFWFIILKVLKKIRRSGLM